MDKKMNATTTVMPHADDQMKKDCGKMQATATQAHQKEMKR